MGLFSSFQKKTATATEKPAQKKPKDFNIRMILFDFDGVIVDSSRDIISAVTATLAHFGLPKIPDNTIISFVGNGARNLILHSVQCSLEILHNKDTLVEQIEEIFHWYLDYYESHAVVETTLYHGVPELLETLYILGFRMGIVSNKPQAITEKILEHFGIAAFFDSVICPEQISKMKPNPEGLALATQQIYETNKELFANKPVKPSEVLMVGDSDTDIQAGRSFGAKTCAFTVGLGNKDKLFAEKPDISIDQIRFLLFYM